MTELNRRDLIGALAALPFVRKVDEVNEKTRALVLTVDVGVDVDAGTLKQFHEAVDNTLRKNGLDMPVILVHNTVVHVIG